MAIGQLSVLAGALVALATANPLNEWLPPAGPVTAADAWPTDVPFWPQYPLRKVTVLNGTWAFGIQATGCDPTSVPYNSISTPNTTAVPGAFDVAPPGILGGRVPCAFYRSTHTCTPGLPSLLKFYAVNFYARVFVDGQVIGNNTSGGYTPFEMLAPACGAGGTREVAVVVSNQQNYTLSPTFTGGDFYFYSGIIRPVIVTELPQQSVAPGAGYWLDRVEPLSRDYVRGLIDVRVVLGGNWSAAKGQVHLAYGFNGGTVGSPVSAPVVNGEAVLSNIAVPQGTPLWTLGQGGLFTLTIVDNFIGDAITVRTGLRVLGVDPATSRITINGQIVKLLGFNRHTMWPDTGAAVTHAQEAADMAQIKGISANYIRGAHYPQSQSWLDLCDENGVAMWEETLGPGTSTSNMHDPWFMANHLTAVSSMVGHSFSHPSVILHAFFNEGPSDDPNACVGYAASASTIKARVTTPGSPPWRLVTWANNHVDGDVCIPYEDVISFNSYPGWYDHEGNLTYVGVYWGGKVQWAADNWPDKPLTISETGGGGVWEWHNDTAPYPGPQWSQFFQKNLVTTDAAFLANHSHVSGLTLWQYSDIKANDQSTQQCGQCQYLPHPNNLTVPWDCAYIDVTCGRPGGENHKGAVDFWRRQKEEYAPLQQIYAQYSTQEE